MTQKWAHFSVYDDIGNVLEELFIELDPRAEQIHASSSTLRQDAPAPRTILPRTTQPERSTHA